MKVILFVNYIVLCIVFGNYIYYMEDGHDTLLICDLCPKY